MDSSEVEQARFLEFVWVSLVNESPMLVSVGRTAVKQ